MKKDKAKFLILGKKWEMRAMKDPDFSREHGPESAAITDVSKRIIIIGPDGRTLETVVHELVHAYLGELCVHSCDLDSDNLEEIFAELVAKRGKELLRLAAKLYSTVAA